MIVQPDLAPGETIAWSGQPNPRVIFHKEDLFLIPFSLLWGGFAIFWEAGVSGFWGNGTRGGGWILGMIWGVPFVLVGQYLIWGRFVYDAWLKRCTYCAVTNRRVLVIQNAWGRKMVGAYLESLPTLTKEARDSGSGTLRFSSNVPLFARRGWGPWNPMSAGDAPIFHDIDDLDHVYRLVSDLRERSRSSKS